MFRLCTSGFRLCDGLTRREWLRVGGFGMLGWNLTAGDLNQTQARARSRQENPNPAATNATLEPGNAVLGPGWGKARSCILLWMTGGPPQHETWDPKPDAPREIRGDLGSIETNVPGIRVGELMPKVARHLDKIAVLRALSTQDQAHTSSGYSMLTGQRYFLGPNRESMPPSAQDWPSITAVAQRFRPSQGGFPSAVALPEILYNNPRVVWPGQNAGFLGRAHDPWLVECDDRMSMPTLSLPEGVSTQRVEARRALRSVLAHSGRLLGTSEPITPVVESHERLFHQACDLLANPAVRRAFDLELEDPRLRERYGPHKWGQSCLLARRLIESGVRIVQVNWPRDGAANEGNPVWDIHNDGYQRLKNKLMPPMDQGYSALLEDLSARGLLDNTLVVWAGEFGRTPRLDAGGSRNHWGHVFSAALAGGGIRGGIVHGASDKIGGQPLNDTVRPEDFAATIFAALGIPINTVIYDTLSRPNAITKGKPVSAVI